MKIQVACLKMDPKKCSEIGVALLRLICASLKTSTRGLTPESLKIFKGVYFYYISRLSTTRVSITVNNSVHRYPTLSNLAIVRTICQDAVNKINSRSKR